MSPATTLNAMAVRAERLQSLTAIVDAHLTRGSGQSVRLEGALAARRPHFLRLQLWKLNRTIIDLTVLPDGVWLWSRESTPPIGRHAWFTLPLTDGEFYRAPATVREHGRHLHMARPLAGGLTLHATVDRTTLTLREIRVVGGEGDVAQVVLDDYRVMEGSAIPTRCTLTHHGHTIGLRLRHIVLNKSLDARAFTPPPRAVRLTPEP